jgi:hypothetical protein
MTEIIAIDRKGDTSSCVATLTPKLLSLRFAQRPLIAIVFLILILDILAS